VDFIAVRDVGGGIDAKWNSENIQSSSQITICNILSEAFRPFVVQ